MEFSITVFSPFQAILSTFRFSPQKTKKSSGREGPPNFFSLQILFFLWVKTPCKILEPYDNPFWEKSYPVNSGDLVPWQCKQPLVPISEF